MSDPTPTAITADTVASFTATAQKFGLSAEQISATVNKHNVAPPAQNSPPPANTPPPAQSEAAAFDATLGGAASDQYNLDGLFVGRKELSFSDMKAFDGTLRSALSGMQFNAVLGANMAEAFVAADGVYNGLRSDAQRSLFHTEQRILAERVTGAKWDDLVATAKLAVAKIPAASATMLAERGVFEDHRVLVNLFRQAERLRYRQSLK